MEEIKVGEYIRTKSGNIGKVLDITNVTMQKRKKYLIKWNISKAYYITAIRIVKHSPNLIDLMQVKDVIEYIEQTEGREGTKVGESYITDIHSENELNEIKKEIQENGIKLLSIVTKEIFNQVKYEV